MSRRTSAAGHNLFAPAELRFRDAVAAILTVDDGRYLVQLRDDRPGVFYPGHWGLFGGAIEPGETPEAALRRELEEEIAFSPVDLRPFTRMDFDFSPFDAGRCVRLFYEGMIEAARLPDLRLGEGQRMEAVHLPELLIERPVAPYDSFALWMHHTARGHGRLVGTA